MNQGPEMVMICNRKRQAYVQIDSSKYYALLISTFTQPCPKYINTRIAYIIFIIYIKIHAKRKKKKRNWNKRREQTQTDIAIIFLCISLTETENKKQPTEKSYGKKIMNATSEIENWTREREDKMVK